MKHTQPQLRAMIAPTCKIYPSMDDLSLNMSEDGCLSTVVAWFKATWPEYSNLIYHIPNEGKHQTQKKFNMGVLPGAPDLVLALPRGGYGCYAFDAKRDKKYQHSFNQVNVINEMSKYNFAGYWFGVTAGKQSLIDYMNLPIAKF